jgi:hypothetical protein
VGNFCPTILGNFSPPLTPVEIERADPGRDRKEQPKSKQRGADGSQNIRGPRQPALEQQHSVHRPDRTGM